jgi:DnaJ-class molecular chaperone
MKGHDTNSVCKKCTKPYCHEEVVCPECNGQGLFDAMPLVEESIDYGLNLAEEFACTVCDGRGTVTDYCTHYVDRLVPAYSPARRNAVQPAEPLLHTVVNK